MPATNGRPRESSPQRCQRMTSSATGRKRWFGQSLHLILGFSQTPRTHSLLQAGWYPARPVFLLSKRRGYTSSRPRKRERNSLIFASGGECCVMESPELTDDLSAELWKTSLEEDGCVVT